MDTGCFREGYLDAQRCPRQLSQEPLGPLSADSSTGSLGSESADIEPDRADSRLSGPSLAWPCRAPAWPCILGMSICDVPSAFCPQPPCSGALSSSEPCRFGADGTCWRSRKIGSRQKGDFGARPAGPDAINGPRALQAELSPLAPGWVLGGSPSFRGRGS